MKSLLNSLAWPVLMGSFLSVVVLGCFASWLYFSQHCEQSQFCVSGWSTLWASRPNEVGDTLAGIASSLAFIWIIVTVWLQSTELREQREELRLQREELEKTNDHLEYQRFEATYFEMMKQLNSITGSMRENNAGTSYSGREVFARYHEQLSNYFHIRARAGQIVDYADSFEPAKAAFESFFDSYGVKLSGYFRFVYNFLRFLDQSKIAGPFHAKLLRSQFSDYELAILFYNCFSARGINMANFAGKFALFDNIPDGVLLHPSHRWAAPSNFFSSSEPEAAP